MNNNFVPLSALGQLPTDYRSQSMIAPYGYRVTGEPKGLGFLGLMQTPDNRQMSEYSIGVNGTEMPTVVPTLTDKEMRFLLTQPSPDQFPDMMFQKILDHANKRISSGQKTFATPSDVPQWRRLGD